MDKQNKIDLLTTKLTDWLESADAQDLNTINNLTEVKHLVDDVKAELNELSTENKSLVDAYKTAIKHTSFSDPSVMPRDTISDAPVSFDEALAKFIKNKIL